MPWALAVLFLITAALYASVGFGGGSTYTALLVLNGTDYRILPTIALSCNILVVTGGLWRFQKAGHLDIRAVSPFLVTSIPAAWLGGRLAVSETLFIGLLGFALLLSGLQLLFQQNLEVKSLEHSKTTVFVAPIVGGAIGLLAGVVGIGGGIFLAPVLYFLKWGTAHRIAAACCLFIFANSVAGLFGHISKFDNNDVTQDIVAYWPLFLAVIIGGQLGSYIGSKKLKPIFIKRLTALLILYVALRLLKNWVSLVG